MLHHKTSQQNPTRWFMLASTAAKPPIQSFLDAWDKFLRGVLDFETHARPHGGCALFLPFCSGWTFALSFVFKCCSDTSSVVMIPSFTILRPKTTYFSSIAKENRLVFCICSWGQGAIFISDVVIISWNKIQSVWLFGWLIAEWGCRIAGLRGRC